MKNILKIFRADLHNVGTSVIGMVVVVGLVVVPCLYAWFNIAGSWDPYGNTGNLKIAVVNTDEGYESELIPVEVNVGDTVVSSLRANDSFDWIVVSEKDDAVEGVKSGEYYAAVVIPKTFSADMMTLFSTEVKHADIEFYENQKSNAIAQIVTEKGSSAVQKQVNETFTQTIDEIGLKTVSNLLGYMGTDEVSNFATNLSDSITEAVNDLRNVADSTGSLSSTLESTSGLLTSTSGLLDDNNTATDDAKSVLGKAQDGLSSIEGALGNATSAADDAISSSTGSLGDISASVDAALAAGNKHVADSVAQLRAAKDELDSKLAGSNSVLQDAIDDLSDWAQGHDPTLDSYEPGQAGLGDVVLQPLVEGAVSSLQNVQSECQQLSQKIEDAATSLQNGTTDVASAKADIQNTIDGIKQDLSSAQGDYESALKSQAGELKDSVSGVVSSGEDISNSLGNTMDSLTGASNSLASDLNGVNSTLSSTSGNLNDTAQKLADLQQAISDALASGDLSSVQTLLSGDPEDLAVALAAPVGLDRKAIYPVENYGSAMAPFYTILSLWVGSIVLAAMMKVTLNDELFNSLIPVRLHQIYLGRYLFFGLLALMQSTLVSLGDILFFGIQCDNHFLFILGCWVASIVFSNIVYTLTVSFGDIGKALAVVLLVMQVGGSGGTFPIEMTAPFFQAVYPWLPFTHAINALHAAVAGAYGMEYWQELGLLAAYLIPSLALGIVFRRPVIRANNFIIEKLEETKVM